MCGIAGIIGRDAAADVGAAVERLTAALGHRGPDGHGFHYLAGRRAALGHRRLSIVDLEHGAQPMTNVEGTFSVVFNGEIYNHLELRRELERDGARYRTRSDTETLVHGWAAWGPRLLERLNGVYAFALYDAAERALWLARDPLGVKPLYVGTSAVGLWFASELAAARESGLLDPALREEAVDEYLVYRFIPAPATPYRHAWKLPPSHLCRVSLDAPAAEPRFEHFTPSFAPASVPGDTGGWMEAIRAGLAAAIERQLMADVPVGSLLSGGVDSTVVTAVMRGALARPPQAFAVGFADSPEGNELVAARRAASALGVPLAELALRERDLVDSWPAQIARLGEPVANPGVPLVALLSRLVRQTHKVVLSGQGADEPLGGYARHTVERAASLLRLARPLLGAVPECLAGGDKIARLRRVSAAPDEARRHTETLAVFGPAEAVRLTGHRVDPQALAEPVRRWLGRSRQEESFSRLLEVDMRLSLADDLLTVADHTSMASGVELRVPFLDLELVALLERMPARYKVSLLGERKWLYRRAVEPLVPAAVRGELTGWRARVGRKYGFSTPVDRWYPRWLAGEAQGFLLGRDARLPHLLDRRRLTAWLTEVRERRLPRQRQVISLYVLEVWARAAGAAG